MLLARTFERSHEKHLAIFPSLSFSCALSVSVISAQKRSPFCSALRFSLPFTQIERVIRIAILYVITVSLRYSFNTARAVILTHEDRTTFARRFASLSLSLSLSLSNPPHANPLVWRTTVR